MPSSTIEFDDIDEKRLLIAGIITNSLSILGSLFISTMYICYKDMQSFAFKLVFFLALSDIIFGIGRLFNFEQFLQDEISPEVDLPCYIQSVLTSFGGLSTIMATIAISWSLVQSVVNGVTELNTYLIQYILVIFVFPLAVSFLPFLTNSYGISGYYCWIKSNDADTTIGPLAWRLGLFYVPLWISIIFNFYNYYRILRYVEFIFDDASEQSKIHKQMIKKLTYYPLIMVVCYSFASINRIYGFFNSHESLTITYLHVTLGGLQGFFNSIVYGFNKQIKAKISACCCCCIAKQTIAVSEDQKSNRSNSRQDFRDTKTIVEEYEIHDRFNSSASSIDRSSYGNDDEYQSSVQNKMRRQLGQDLYTDYDQTTINNPHFSRNRPVHHSTQMTNVKNS